VDGARANEPLGDTWPPVPPTPAAAVSSTRPHQETGDDEVGDGAGPQASVGDGTEGRQRMLSLNRREETDDFGVKLIACSKASERAMPVRLYVLFRDTVSEHEPNLRTGDELKTINGVDTAAAPLSQIRQVGMVPACARRATLW